MLNFLSKTCVSSHNKWLGSSVCCKNIQWCVSTFIPKARLWICDNIHNSFHTEPALQRMHRKELSTMRRDFYPVWRDSKKSSSRRSTNSKNLISESLSLISPTADLVEPQWSSLSAEIFGHNQHESRFYQLYFMAKLALKAFIFPVRNHKNIWAQLISFIYTATTHSS